MPRPVVPILRSPFASSRARSSWPWLGRMSAALAATLSVAGVTSTPLSRIFAISASSAHGSTTTPLPMIESLSGRTPPEGSSESRYSTLPITSVWPALWPPWKRTTTSARCDSQSTILPLPSSPHWAPITATFAISPQSETGRTETETQPRRKVKRLAERHGRAALEHRGAAEPARLGRGVRRLGQPGDGDPALAAQPRRRRRVDAERDEDPARRRARRHGG